ncbi:hypothetical protein URH17368_0126 [Alicyclobacillus hesperidum URH17-3-68]|nr:hypothetical protein URH17368_0126 [Alicyclobacillus hesperidum URH17-3-68]
MSASSSQAGSFNVQTLVQEVNPYIKTSANGTLSIAPSTLSQLNLTSQEQSFVLNGISNYNSLVLNHEVNPLTHLAGLVSSMSQAASLSSATAASTDGLPASWFTSSSPQTAEFDYWWGDQQVYNEKATRNLIKDATLVASGASLAGAALAPVPGVDVLSVVAGLYAGIYGFSAAMLDSYDNGYGDWINWAGGVPFNMGGNVA